MAGAGEPPVPESDDEQHEVNDETEANTQTHLGTTHVPEQVGNTELSLLRDMMRVLGDQTRALQDHLRASSEEVREIRAHVFGNAAGFERGMSGDRSDDTQTLPKLVSNKEPWKDGKVHLDRSVWPDFEHRFKVHVGGVHWKFRKALEWAENTEEENVSDGMLTKEDPDYEAIAAQVYTKLAGIVEGQASVMVRNVTGGNGLLAWRKLAKFFDPNTAHTRRSL